MEIPMRGRGPRDDGGSHRVFGLENFAEQHEPRLHLTQGTEFGWHSLLSFAFCSCVSSRCRRGGGRRIGKGRAGGETQNVTRSVGYEALREGTPPLSEGACIRGERLTSVSEAYLPYVVSGAMVHVGFLERQVAGEHKKEADRSSGQVVDSNTRAGRVHVKWRGA